MNGRNESKYYINTADYMQLRSRLRHIAKPDEHSDDNGQYKVRSLYFDNYEDKAVTEKLAGVGRREKFRIRYYNGDLSFIRLEKKSKQDKLCYKESAVLTHGLCREILNGKYAGLISENSPLLAELYAKMNFQQLRPKVIVEYIREAYAYGAGNVRITFDSGVKMSNGVTEFLNPGIAAIPAANAIILEIKFDAFLPDIIRDILWINSRSRTEFSKYVVSRLV